MNQYHFRMTFFNEARRKVEKYSGINTMDNISAELLKADVAEGYYLVEFSATRLPEKGKNHGTG